MSFLEFAYRLGFVMLGMMTVMASALAWWSRGSKIVFWDAIVVVLVSTASAWWLWRNRKKEYAQQKWNREHGSPPFFREWLLAAYASSMPLDQYLLLDFLSHLSTFPKFNLDDVDRAACRFEGAFNPADPLAGRWLVRRGFEVLLALGEITLESPETFTLQPLIQKRVLPFFREFGGES